MILELGDGRELRLPDEVSDEFARQLKSFILGHEERAKASETAIESLRGELASMRAASAGQNTAGLEAALLQTQQAAQANAESIRRNASILQQILRIVSSDRVLIKDEFGQHRSRVAVE